jgi:hypothetical protein
MDIVIDYWAVFGAAVAAMVLGFLWFGPLFGKQWTRAMGISHEQMEEMKAKGMPSMWRSYLIMFIGALVMAFVLAHVLVAFGNVMGGIDSGVSAGLWMWIGFVAPVTIGSVLWEKRSWRYWFITSGYYLVSLILMSIIIASGS